MLTLKFVCTRTIVPAFMLIFALSLWHGPLKSEAFGNNSLTIPRVGMAFFDAPVLYHKKPWGLNHQWTFGSSFMQALNYRWWWIVDTGLGLGKLVNTDATIGVFLGGAGLRFNVFEGDFRPHVSLTLHYLHFLGDGTRHLPLNLGWPIFVGLKPTIGLEWLFYSEMSLIIDGSYGIYVNINEPFRQALFANAAFALYF